MWQIGPLCHNHWGTSWEHILDILSYTQNKCSSNIFTNLQISLLNPYGLEEGGNGILMLPYQISDKYWASMIWPAISLCMHDYTLVGCP